LFSDPQLGRTKKLTKNLFKNQVQNQQEKHQKISLEYIFQTSADWGKEKIGTLLKISDKNAIILLLALCDKKI